MHNIFPQSWIGTIEFHYYGGKVNTKGRESPASISQCLLHSNLKTISFESLMAKEKREYLKISCLHNYEKNQNTGSYKHVNSQAIDTQNAFSGHILAQCPCRKKGKKLPAFLEAFEVSAIYGLSPCSWVA